MAYIQYKCQAQDKTVVVLVNSIKTKRQPKEYYQEPDWAALKKKHDEEWKRAAYPGLYKKEEQTAAEAAQRLEQEPAQSVQTKSKSSAIHKPRKLNKLRVLLVAVPIVAFLSVAGIGINMLITSNDEFSDNNNSHMSYEGIAPEPTPEPSPTPTPEPENATPPALYIELSE